MNNDNGDNGFTINQLWGAAWLLGLAALGSAIPVITDASKGAPHQDQVVLWAFVGVVAAVFSACSAVLAGIKSAEQRLARRFAQTQV